MDIFFGEGVRFSVTCFTVRKVRKYWSKTRYHIERPHGTPIFVCVFYLLLSLFFLPLCLCITKSKV